VIDVRVSPVEPMRALPLLVLGKILIDSRVQVDRAVFAAS
jgi:hypothetical protein